MFIGPKQGIANGWYEWLNSWYYGDGVYYDISVIPLDSPQDFSSANLVREYAWWPDSSVPGYGDRVKQWAASIVGCQPTEIEIIDS